MSDLRIASGPADREGRVLAVTPERARWRHVGFGAFKLPGGARLRRNLEARELCVVVLGGRCVIRSEAGEWTLGERATPFDGPPAAAYLPPGSAFEIEARGAAELAFGSAPATRGAAARALVSPRLEVRGSGVTERRIHHILMEDAAAESLLVTEVVTPAGHWSSYPPHKHDTNDPPRETQLEETYYHRLRDERGFALQRVYTADRSLDESIAVRDGDLVLVPRGYHTVSAAPGYELYYLNVMAGPVRRWNVTFDPDHQRLRG
ncbi:MAG TPA: 5-deoxy-glucuronate isomerase [Nevskiaceae bacterium]|nr:5-deoxy-glucuronate isomerase [Nevskiaceae bacterium]